MGTLALVAHLPRSIFEYVTQTLSQKSWGKTIAPSVRRAFALFAVFGLLSTACGGSSPGLTFDSARLTFDGENCTYEGPTELKAGPVTIELVNEMEEAAVGEFRNDSQVNLMRHTGGESIQDMIDYLGPEPSTRHQPFWVSNPEPQPWNFPLYAGRTFSWEGSLEPGTYTLICARATPFGVWFGTGLIIEN